MADVTQLLNALEQGDPHAADLLLPLVYEELRRLAAQRLTQESAGQTLASSNHDGGIRLWDLARWRREETATPLQLLRGHGSFVETIAWRPDGRLLASHGFMDGTVRLWDVTGPQPRHQEIRLFLPNTRYLFGLAFTPEGRHLAVATPGNAIYVLRLAERGKVYEVP